MEALVAKSNRDLRRERILQVAREVFFEEGYASASMSSIAARLGGSKGTLYNYFRSKEELFEAHIQDGCAKIAADAFNLPAEPTEVAPVLQRLGERYLSHVFSDWAIRTFRMLVAESRRSPELSRIFYETGPAVGLRRLEAFLERAKARSLIRADDCAQAANQFMALCRGNMHFQFVLNLSPQPTPEQISREVAAAVATFMAAYGSEKRG